MNRKALFSVLLAAAVIVLAGCGDSDTNTTSTQPAHTKKDRAVADAVVYVTSQYKDHKTAGTGFIYDAQKGLVLTANHLVETAPTITVTDRHGEVMHGQVLARAQCHDFAVVKLHPIPTDLHALTLSDSGAVKDGAEVSAVAYALTSAETGAPTLVTTRGNVSAANVAAKLHHLLPTFSPLIAHQAPLNANGSGSPLLDADGRVVGLNTLVGFEHGDGAVEGLNYALASSFIYERLRQLRSGSNRDLVGWRDEHRCHEQADVIAKVPSHTHDDHAMDDHDDAHHDDDHMDEDGHHDDTKKSDSDTHM